MSADEQLAEAALRIRAEYPDIDDFRMRQWEREIAERESAAGDPS